MIWVFLYRYKTWVISTLYIIHHTVSVYLHWYLISRMIQTRCAVIVTFVHRVLTTVFSFMNYMYLDFFLNISVHVNFFPRWLLFWLTITPFNTNQFIFMLLFSPLGWSFICEFLFESPSRNFFFFAFPLQYLRW